MANIFQINNAAVPSFLSPDDCHSYLEKLMTERRYPEILAAAGKMLTLRPRDPMLLYYLANAYYYSDRFSEAIAVADELIAHDPDNAGNYILRGNACDDLGKTVPAFKNYITAIKLEPDNSAAYYELAVLLRRCGKPQRALKDARRSWELNENDLPAIRLCMKLCCDLEDFASALEWSDRLLARRRASSEDYVCRVLCKTELGAPPEDVLPDAIRATELNLINPEAWFRLGETEIAAGKYDAAVESLTRSIELEPRDCAFSSRGDALFYLGRDGEALADYDRSIGMTPDDPIFRARRGRLLADLGDRPEDAMTDLSVYLKEYPDDADALYSRGLAGFQLEHYPGAAADLRESIRLGIDNPFAHYYLAACLNALEQHREALVQAEIALEADRSNPFFNLACGLILRDLGQHGSAGQYIRAARKFASATDLPAIEAALARMK